MMFNLFLVHELTFFIKLVINLILLDILLIINIGGGSVYEFGKNEYDFK